MVSKVKAICCFPCNFLTLQHNAIFLQSSTTPYLENPNFTHTEAALRIRRTHTVEAGVTITINKNQYRRRKIGSSVHY